jgi:hypothetical protein
MITELNKSQGPEWGGKAIEKKNPLLAFLPYLSLFFITLSEQCKRTD